MANPYITVEKVAGWPTTITIHRADRQGENGCSDDVIVQLAKELLADGNVGQGYHPFKDEAIARQEEALKYLDAIGVVREPLF